MTEAELEEAMTKAMIATNLCMKHMEYHGQKFEDCTPQERVLIKAKKPPVKNKEK